MLDDFFTRALLARTLRSVCVDLDSIHVTGISAGGMMTYQTAMDLSPLLASAAPIAGSRIYGYNAPPRSPISLRPTVFCIYPARLVREEGGLTGMETSTHLLPPGRSVHVYHAPH